MKIVKIAGGLGNQLFQYAFYLNLTNKYDEKICLDSLDMVTYRLHNGFELENIFNLQANYCTISERKKVRKDGNVFSKLISSMTKKMGINRNYILEPKLEHFTFDESRFGEALMSIYYKGYWQHLKYLEGVDSQLRKNLVFPKFTDEKNISLANLIEQNNTVSIHVRRGDYVQHRSFGGICDLTYYQEAVKKITDIVVNPVFIVFSDDIVWCKDNLDLANAKFVDWNQGENSYRDMQLMSLCKHNIIANSSFSWWGAWLNKHESKQVICPDKWVHYSPELGILPDDWIKVKASL